MDSEGPPAIFYQAYDGAIFAHARGMLTDALQVGLGKTLPPRGSVDLQQNLQNIVNSVDFDVVEVAGGVITITGSIPFDDPDSVTALRGARVWRPATVRCAWPRMTSGTWRGSSWLNMHSG